MDQKIKKKKKKGRIVSLSGKAVVNTRAKHKDKKKQG